MGKRHETIGIKQAIRFEWMQKQPICYWQGLMPKLSGRNYMSSWQTERSVTQNTSKASRLELLLLTI